MVIFSFFVNDIIEVIFLEDLVVRVEDLEKQIQKIQELFEILINANVRLENEMLEGINLLYLNIKLATEKAEKMSDHVQHIS